MVARRLLELALSISSDRSRHVDSHAASSSSTTTTTTTTTATASSFLGSGGGVDAGSGEGAALAALEALAELAPRAEARVLLLQGNAVASFSAALANAFAVRGAGAILAGELLRVRTAAAVRAGALLRVLIAATSPGAQSKDMQLAVLAAPGFADFLQLALATFEAYGVTSTVMAADPSTASSVRVSRSHGSRHDPLANEALQELVALLVRNLAAHRSLKARVIALPGVLPFLLHSLGPAATASPHDGGWELDSSAAFETGRSPGAALVAAASAALWCLLHHCERAKPMAKCDERTSVGAKLGLSVHSDSLTAAIQTARMRFEKRSHVGGDGERHAESVFEKRALRHLDMLQELSLTK